MMAVEYKRPTSDIKSQWDVVVGGATPYYSITKNYTPYEETWVLYPDPTQHPDYGKPWTVEDMNGGKDDPYSHLGIREMSSSFGCMASAGEPPKLRDPLIYVNGTRYNEPIVTDGFLLKSQLVDLGALEDCWGSFISDPATCEAWIESMIDCLVPSRWARIKLWFKMMFDKML